MNNEIVIGLMADGWEVILPNGERYSWTHNDDDLGTDALAQMFRDMGYDAKVEEWY